MNKTEILKELQKWRDVQKTLDDQLDLFYDLIGAQPESPLLDAIYAVAEAHAKAVARLIGDNSEWLAWYKFENGWGENGLRAALGESDPQPINSLAQLVDLIGESES